MYFEILIKLIIFISQISIIGGRGMARKFLISFIRIITRESGNMKLKINNVPFKIHFDTDFKAIFGNYNLKEILDLIKIIKPQKTILTNLHSDMDYSELKNKLPKNIIPAHDGLTIEL